MMWSLCCDRGLLHHVSPVIYTRLNVDIELSLKIIVPTEIPVWVHFCIERLRGIDAAVSYCNKRIISIKTCQAIWQEDTVIVALEAIVNLSIRRISNIAASITWDHHGLKTFPPKTQYLKKKLIGVGETSVLYRANTDPVDKGQWMLSESSWLQLPGLVAVSNVLKNFITVYSRRPGVHVCMLRYTVVYLAAIIQASSFHVRLIPVKAPRGSGSNLGSIAFLQSAHRLGKIALLWKRLWILAIFLLITLLFWSLDLHSSPEPDL